MATKRAHLKICLGEVELGSGEWQYFSNEEGDDFELVGPKVHITGGGTGGGAFAGAVLVPVAACPNPPHIHKDLIIAWANGADIEINDGFGWQHIKEPSWYENGTYRIKSTKTPLQIEIEELEAKLVKLKGQL